MVWRRWFETATYMIDGVFDRLPVRAAVHDGLDGDFLLPDFDEAQGIGYIEYPLVPSTSRIKIRSGRVLCCGSVVRGSAVGVRFRRCHHRTRRDREDEFGGLR
jgi:hypothetical protein